MNKFLILCMTCLCYYDMSAQNKRQSEPTVLVEYRDGTVFRGEVLDDGETHLKLKLSTGDTISVNKEATLKILESPDDIILHRNGKYHYTDHLFWSVGWGIHGSEEVSSHLEAIVGQRLNKKVSVGIGTGLELNTSNFGGFFVDTQFIPVFGVGRYYLTHKLERLYVQMRAGYGIAANNVEFIDGNLGGVQFQPVLGFHYASKTRTRFNLGFGYHIQKIKGTEIFLDPFQNEVEAKYNFWSSRFLLKFTAEFF